jgi:hypothetical protein
VYRIVFKREMLRRGIVDAVAFGTDIFHLSCHGDEDGVQLTDGTCLSWAELADEFAPLAAPERILVNSSCGGGHVAMAKAFGEAGSRFGYVCGSTTKTAAYHDLCLAWSILYNVPANHEAADGEKLRDAFKDAMAKINGVVQGDFVYRRWDEEKGHYRRFPKMPSEERAILAGLLNGAI